MRKREREGEGEKEKDREKERDGMNDSWTAYQNQEHWHILPEFCGPAQLPWLLSDTPHTCKHPSFSHMINSLTWYKEQRKCKQEYKYTAFGELPPIITPQRKEGSMCSHL